MKSLLWKIVNLLQIPRFCLFCFRAPRILLYHGVTERENFFGIENYRHKHIPQKAFRQQLQLIRAHFRVVPLQSLIEAWSSAPKKARGMLAITFDDGYRDIFRVAWPILQDYSIPFTIFLPTDFIEQQKPLWVDQLEYTINHCQINELKITPPGDFSF